MTEDLKLRTTIVPLFQGDDVDAIADLGKTVEAKARTSTPARMNEPDPMTEVARDYDEFLDAALERAVKVGIAALGRKKFREILNAHPPRTEVLEDGTVEVHEDDEGRGFNSETLGDTLVPACMAAYWDDYEERTAARSAGEDPPETDARRFADEASMSAFLDRLSDGDFSKLLSAALRLNQGLGPDPKVRLSGLLEQTSDATSEQHEQQE